MAVFRDCVIAALRTKGLSTLLVDEVVGGMGWLFYAAPLVDKGGAVKGWELTFECQQGEGDLATRSIKSVVCQPADLDVACRVLVSDVHEAYLVAAGKK